MTEQAGALILDQAADPASIDVPSTAVSLVLESVLGQAIREGATDVHFVPGPRGYQVSSRVDGVLRPVLEIPREQQEAAVRCLQYWAGLEGATGPDQGEIVVRSSGLPYYVRTHQMTTVTGPRVNLSIRNPRSLSDWTSIKMPEEAVRLTARSRGLVLFVGPTGSGKTTVLFAALSAVDTVARSVGLVNDSMGVPVPGVARIAGSIDDTGTVSALQRMDLDVLAIGEVQTATEVKLALETAADRLVLSVLHADDAVDAIDRLLLLGAGPRPLADHLVGVVSSRLVRKICPECREEYEPGPADQKTMGLAAGKRLQRGRGCENCRGTGYRGRAALYEVLVVDASIARNIAAGGAGLRADLAAKGFRTYRDEGASMVGAGMTTVEEMNRVIGRIA